jgi:XTP/dITP diphosphohydrolase
MVDDPRMSDDPPLSDDAPMTLTLLATTHRVAPGLLTWSAWSLLRESRVLTGSAGHPQLPYLREAGVEVEVLGDDPHRLAERLVEAATAGSAARPEETAGEAGAGAADLRPVVWLAAPDGDEELLRAVGAVVVALQDPPDVEVVHGSYDLPGARLLDVVSTMDTLRRECPWDIKQTHESLAPYLLEESYEALEAVETGDHQALCEELGDVLIQVAFHSRVAEERTDGTGFTIDDVAAGIVDKMVRRHPHVFGAVEVSGSDEVKANWEDIKAAERAAKRDDGDDGSVFDGVPFGQPALALANALQRRSARADVPDGILTLADVDLDNGGDAGTHEIAVDLFATVRRARQLGVDPEAALRTAARRFRDRVREWERGDGRDAAAGDDA